MAEEKQKTKGAGAAASAKLRFELGLDDIKSLFELMKANDVAEFDLEQGATKVRVVSSRTSGAAAPQPQHVIQMAPSPYIHAPMPSQVPAAPISNEPPGETLAPVPAVAEASPEPSNLKTVVSPMVGTFYRAPAPDAPPFVEVGDRVTEDSVLCIIEAMKLFNEIKADCRGRVVRIPVENGMPVEYNQPLFVIEPI